MENNTPTHLGFIADGNRRWAQSQGLSTLEGHKTGLQKVELVATNCFNAGVQYVTFYLFSNENWSRSAEEVGGLMKLAESRILALAKKVAKNNIRLVLLGSHDRVPQGLLQKIAAAEDLTKSGTKGTLAICFNYGGREEIAEATSKIAQTGDKITPETISKNLYHPEIPDLDMVIRTSGEERISGFMLWRASYAEFLFLKKYWPEITPKDIDQILTEYASRQRRFGK